MFSVFNDSFYIRQQGLQLPDNPRHGVGYGVQSQGVAVEQHEAQIFLTRGFDDCVLRVKGVGVKPVQKLRKHSELVQAGGRVHGQYICVLANSAVGSGLGIGLGCGPGRDSEDVPRQHPRVVAIESVYLVS